MSTPDIVEGQRIAKLEEALGLKLAEKQSADAEKCGEEAVFPMKSAEVKVDLKIAVRRRKVFELRCRGYKIPDIVKALAEDGQVWSEDTVFRDLHSDSAQEFLEELERQQLADITLSSSRKLKLHFRDRMIERSTPRKSPDVAVNIANQIQVEKNVTVDQLLQRYQQFIQGADKQRSVCSDNSGEQVDKADADGQAKSIP